MLLSLKKELDRNIRTVALMDKGVIPNADRHIFESKIVELDRVIEVKERQKKLHYDDTYTGPRYRYGVTLRPIAYANIPDGSIIWSEREHPKYVFGTIDYPEKLPEEKADHFDMVYLGKFERREEQ